MDRTDLYRSADRLEQAADLMRQANALLSKSTPVRAADAALGAGEGVAFHLEAAIEQTERGVAILHAEIVHTITTQSQPQLNLGAAA